MVRQARALQSFHSADDQIVIILCRLVRKGFDPGKIPPFLKEINFVIPALYRRLVKEENQREEQRPQTDMNNDMTSRAGEAAAATKQGNTITSSPGTFLHLFRVSFQGRILRGEIQPRSSFECWTRWVGRHRAYVLCVF